MQEGPQYRLDSVRIEGPGLDDLDGLPEGIGPFAPGEPYSEEKILRAQEMLARLPDLRKPDGTRHVIDFDQRFDPATGTVRVVLRSRATNAYIVRRIEISGHHRFSDRFYRRRVRIAEGDPFDETKLEQGLARLADSGFIERATPQSVRLTWDHEKRTVDVHVTVEEIGRQRISFTGGAAGWGSTVGIAYNLFDFFGGEELITGHLEGGPASLFTAVQIAREGLFGWRAGAALSFYNSVLRPHMPGSAGRERLFSAHSLGVTQSWSQPVG
ncbi:MAG: POTRA domain-containing protein, partial [Candidatus Acidiferrales bacterium]